MVHHRILRSDGTVRLEYADCFHAVLDVPNPSYNGYIELCKQSDPDNPVTGTFDFNLSSQFFNGGPYHVPVNTCSPPIQVPAGVLTVNEAPKSGVAVNNVTAYSYDQFGNYVNELDSWSPPNLNANVTVMPGGVNLGRLRRSRTMPRLRARSRSARSQDPELS